jgi:hypothetical protein
MDNSDDKIDLDALLEESEAIHGRLAPHPQRPAPQLRSWIERRQGKRIALVTMPQIQRSMAGLINDAMCDQVQLKKLESLMRAHKMLAEVRKLVTEEEISNKINELEARLGKVESKWKTKSTSSMLQ